VRFEISISDEVIDRLAQALAGRLRENDSGWLSTKEAAAYAGCGIEAIDKAMRSGALAHQQPAGRNGLRFTTRADLDRWRRGGSP
jgi:hypothetical protein